MRRCKPARKEHNPNPKKYRNWVSTVTKHPCFICLRAVPAATKYDFVNECAANIMVKMDDDELKLLSQEVLRAVLELDTYETEIDEMYLLGDCLARVFMFTLSRGNYLKEMYCKYDTVKEVIDIAAEKSMPAYGVVSLYKDTPFPQCWLNMSKP